MESLTKLHTKLASDIFSDVVETLIEENIEEISREAKNVKIDGKLYDLKFSISAIHYPDLIKRSSPSN